MRYVIDTHSLVWYFTDDSRLGIKAVKIMDECNSGRLSGIVPTIVLAEVMTISEKKRVALDFTDLLRRIEGATNFEISDLNLEIIKQTQKITILSDLHDRIIVATAQIYSANILSKDKDIRNSGLVEVIW